MESNASTVLDNAIKINTGNVSETEVSKKFWSMISKKLVLGVLVFSAVLVTAVYRLLPIKVSVTQDENKMQNSVVGDFVRQKTVYRKVLPPGFIARVPSTGEISQSYTKAYQDQTQMSVVYYSKDVVSKNFSIYESFLKDDAWKMLQQQQGSKLSIIQAVKDAYRLEVTVIDRSSASSSVKSHVIINLFRK